MRTYCIAQETLSNVLSDLMGRKSKKGGGGIYVSMQLIHFAVQ